jgi:hypothetical protein
MANSVPNHKSSRNAVWIGALVIAFLLGMALANLSRPQANPNVCEPSTANQPGVFLPNGQPYNPTQGTTPASPSASGITKLPPGTSVPSAAPRGTNAATPSNAPFSSGGDVGVPNSAVPNNTAGNGVSGTGQFGTGVGPGGGAAGGGGR